jgi:putative copper export protein
MYGAVVLVHLLAATIWTGGHLVLAVTILPAALKQRDVTQLARFEASYERIGMPALIVQVASGFWLAWQRVPGVSGWFDFADPLARPIAVKLILLLLTIALALDARLRVIPKLSADNLPDLAWHVVPVTVIAVLFVATGLSFRTGWLGL